ncbi:hypothetical protein EV197_2199 [Aquimarina brevivitae]|uniref:Uncharacterized protein n=2 Tax=Aquimarina brevivitae TaxID=323412 RepID=A0A4V2F5Q3_9FLAO|nr:hypothetical protein EV197_2199 [Aquimarina brevivitae]
MFFVFGVPQLYEMWERHQQIETVTLRHELELDALMTLESPSKADQIRIETLNKIISQRNKAALSKDKTIYQTIGLVFFLGLMFVVFAIDRRKLKQTKQIQYQVEDSAQFDDPSFDTVAQQTSWNPLHPGGSNFVSHKLKKIDSNRIKVKKTGTMNIIGWTFLLIGFNYIFFEFLFAYQTDLLFMQGWLKNIQLFFKSGGIFFIIGLFFVLRWGQNSVFDKNMQQFKKGGQQISFSNIYAIQLLTEFVQGNSQGGSSYYSYELNLVLNNGERINVMDHGSPTHIEQDAIVLADFLKIPIWSRM